MSPPQPEAFDDDVAMHIQNELSFIGLMDVEEADRVRSLVRRLVPRGSVGMVNDLTERISKLLIADQENWSPPDLHPPEAPQEGQHSLPLFLESEPFEPFLINESSREAVVWIPAGIHDISYRDAGSIVRYRLGFPHLYVKVFRVSGRRNIYCGVYASSERLRSLSQTVHPFPMLNAENGGQGVCFRYTGRRPRTLRLLTRKVALAYLGSPFNDGTGVPSFDHPIPEIAKGSKGRIDVLMEFLGVWENYTAKHGVKGILELNWSRPKGIPLGRLIDPHDDDSYRRFQITRRA